MISNLIHATSSDVELTESTNTGLNQNHAIVEDEEVGVNETIGHFLKRSKSSLFYFYQLNAGGLYQTKFTNATGCQRTAMAFAVFAELGMIYYLFFNIHSRLSPVLFILPIALVLSYLLVYPIKLAVEYRLQRKCELRRESMHQVVMHSRMANIVGIVLFLIVFINFVYYWITVDPSYFFIWLSWIWLVCDTFLVVSSTTWVIFMIIYNSYVVHQEIDTLRKMARSGELTGALYMQRYRRMKEANSGHLLHDCLAAVSYWNILSFILLLVLAADENWFAVFAQFILLGREGLVVIYLLPFFSSTNESFQDFLVECAQKFADEEIQLLESGEAVDVDLRTVVGVQRQMKVYQLAMKYPFTLTLFGHAVTKESMRTQLFGLILAGLIGIIKVIVESYA